MGQKFAPELHDPDYKKTEGQNDKLLTDEEADRQFDAMVDKLDADERATQTPQ